MVTHAYWIQRLSAEIPVTYIKSLLAGDMELCGQFTIRRSPWFNFLEAAGRRGALLAFFQYFPLETPKPAPLDPICTPKITVGLEEELKAESTEEQTKTQLKVRLDISVAELRSSRGAGKPYY
jgi:hypothetical protein